MSVFRYSGLKPEIIRAVEEMGFEELMPVQEEVIPAILEHESDLIGLAQTGTGKTASFGLRFLHKMNEGIKNPRERNFYNKNKRKKIVSSTNG